MRKHNGMRPQDIVILLKIIAKNSNPWLYKDLANELYISQSEISESLARSTLAGFFNNNTKTVYRLNVMEFIEHGLHYVFPVLPAAMVNGIPTAHSHPFMKKHFQTDLEYVWPESKGKIRGLAIEPLYRDVPKAVLQDENLYKMLSLIDVIRVGKVREWKMAISELKTMIPKHEPSH
ncbi:MAG: hypothetical protein ACR2KB_07495 [Chitinophagaceae bacterium]|jgi:hypothetical protein